MKFLSFILSFLFAYLLMVSLFIDANFLNALFMGFGLMVCLSIFNKETIKQYLNDSDFAPLLKTLFFTLISIGFLFGLVAFACKISEHEAIENAKIWEVAKTYPNPYQYYNLHRI